MTHTAKNPLYRYVAIAFVALAMAVPALPAQAQRYGHGGYHGRPAPHYDNRNYRGRGHGGGNGGAVIAGALLGVIAGTAIANSAQRPPPDVIYTSPPPPPPPGVVYYSN